MSYSSYSKNSNYPYSKKTFELSLPANYIYSADWYTSDIPSDTFYGRRQKDIYTNLALKGKPNSNGAILDYRGLSRFNYNDPNIIHIHIGRKKHSSDYAQPVYNLDNGHRYDLQPDGSFKSTKLNSKQLRNFDIY